jgi:hypothetical protein
MGDDTGRNATIANEQRPAGNAALTGSARRINKLARGLDVTHYIEIGVNSGATFHAVEISQRTAVGPSFAFNPADFSSQKTIFAEVPSDKYFQLLASDITYDIYFIDGLHTFEQTLRDFNNSVVHSHLRTVWLIDDTHPVDVYSTLTDPKWTMLFRHETGNKGLAWHGDVFKLICYIHDFMPSLDYRTIVGSGNGQTLVWRSNANRRVPRFNNLEQISRLSYFDFRENRDLFFECGEEGAIRACLAAVRGSAVPAPARSIAPDHGADAGSDAAADSDKAASQASGVANRERIVALSDVCVEPYVFEPGEARKPNAFLGGIEAEKAPAFGRMAWRSGFRDRPQPRPRVTSPPVAGRSLFAGPVWNHFGHILTESIHRLWPLIGTRYDRIVFTGVIGLRGVLSAEDLLSAEVPAMATSVLKALELPDIEMFLVREPTVFEALDVPQQGSRYQNGVEQFYFEHLETYQQRITQRLPKYAGPKSIYYSRQHILVQGGIIGSSYFEEVMAKAGIVSIVPEEMTVDEQLNYLLNAERIVFDQGSAVHLTELLAHLPGTFYMLPRRPGDNIFCTAFRGRAPFFNLAEDDNIGLLVDKFGDIATPAALAFYKRPEEVFAALARHGLVNGGFDRTRYLECEAADLATVPFRDDTVNGARQTELAKYRDVVMA